MTEWTDYMVKAAKHSKNNARHWFRYLRKYIDKCGVLFSQEQVDELYNNEDLTPFQRVSIRAAFEDGTQTRQHIISLNQRVNPAKILPSRETDEKLNSNK